ncbi:unnamed protein product, partial [Ectocarpus sp. 8 AP-2014]
IFRQLGARIGVEIRGSFDERIFVSDSQRVVSPHEYRYLRHENEPWTFPKVYAGMVREFGTGSTSFGYQYNRAAVHLILPAPPPMQSRITVDPVVRLPTACLNNEKWLEMLLSPVLAFSP